MKTYNYTYNQEQSLVDFINKYKISSEKYVLVQYFISTGNYISDAIETIRTQIPSAKLIGMTTDGAISSSGGIEKDLISFSVFNNTKIDVNNFSTVNHKDSFSLGQYIAMKIVNKDTKLLIVYSDGYKTGSEQLLQGVKSIAPNVNVVGGVAVNPKSSKAKSSLFTHREQLDEGVLVASLSGKELSVHTRSITEWKTAGRSFTITKASGSRINTVDNMKVTELYRRFFGDIAAKNLEDAITQFPLIVKRNGELFPISKKIIHRDGSVTFGQAISEGEPVYLGYGDASVVLNNIPNVKKELKDTPMESIFLYSCLARRHFFKEMVGFETIPFQGIADISGAYLAGELFSSEHRTKLLSHSTIAVFLSEDQMAIPKWNKNDKSIQLSMEKNLNTFLALTHFINTSTEELEILHQTIKESEQRYRSLFDNNPDIVYGLDLLGNILSVNKSLIETLGYCEDEVLHRPATDFIVTEELHRVSKKYRKAIQDQPQHFTTKIRHKNGHFIIFDIAQIPIKVSGEVVGVYGIGKNMTQQMLAEKKINQLAYHDSLTNLPNRLFFHENLVDELLKAKKKGSNLAVMFVDLDGFKIINDTLGHQTGDLILQQIATRLSKVVNDRAFLSRFSGDEFLIYFPYKHTINKVQCFVEEILNSFKKPVYSQHNELFISACIGVSLYPDDTLEEEQLLKNADLALHRAKIYGRNSVAYFTEEMNQHIEERFELENHLQRASKLQELTLHFQPQYDLKQGKLFACEALIRWFHRKRGLISPDQFIPLAEETGLIIEIGRWVLQQACLAAKNWENYGMKDIAVSVNVSGRQFQRLDFIDEVKEALRVSNLPPHLLHLEITESSMITNIQYSIEVMKRIRDLGVRISIDDFGTGYSSLSYLKDLPIDILKIDKSFIQKLGGNTADTAIVRAIIMMCEGLEITVLAEGVETEEQVNLLKEFGCKQAQGYYFGKPMEATMLFTK
jgi:diguanylate cyclase (GGDEF)-like protein/PAS domain S-box-containing protein